MHIKYFNIYYKLIYIKDYTFTYVFFCYILSSDNFYLIFYEFWKLVRKYLAYFSTCG